MIKKICSALFMGFIVSCSSDIDVDYLQEHSKQMLPKRCAAEKLSTSLTNTNSKVVDNEVVDEELVVVYGADRTETVKKAKIALKSATASKFGLPQGVYVVEYLLCYKRISRVGLDVWYVTSENCGYIPTQDFVLGNNSILMTNERGYEEPDSNTNELKTFLIHVVSDIYGRKVDRYAPCLPKDIEWKYSITPQV